jgi:hypothetical protein
MRRECFEEFNIDAGRKAKIVVLRPLYLYVSVAALLTGAAPTAGPLPDRSLTPGDILNVTTADICQPGYSRNVRDVTAQTKRTVYSSYRRMLEEGKCCEVDHLIPLELGGSNRIKNLWPEPYDGEWNARVKDRLDVAYVNNGEARHPNNR